MIYIKNNNPTYIYCFIKRHHDALALCVNVKMKRNQRKKIKRKKDRKCSVHS